MATLTQQDYFLKPGESLSSYNQRIAQARGDTPESLANIQSLTTQAISSANLAPTPSITPVTTTQTTPIPFVSVPPPQTTSSGVGFSPDQLKAFNQALINGNLAEA